MNLAIKTPLVVLSILVGGVLLRFFLWWLAVGLLEFSGLLPPRRGRCVYKPAPSDVLASESQTKDSSSDPR